MMVAELSSICLFPSRNTKHYELGWVLLLNNLIRAGRRLGLQVGVQDDGVQCQRGPGVQG